MSKKTIVPRRIKDLILEEFDDPSIKVKRTDFGDDNYYLNIIVSGLLNNVLTNNTKEFWESIYLEEYQPFYEKYGFVGDIKEYPTDIVFKMCDEQVRQGNLWNVEVFERDALATIKEGGFNWSGSKKGFDYWITIWETLYNQSEKKSTQNISPENSILLKSGMVVIFRGGWCGVLFDYKGELKIMCPELETVIDIESYDSDLISPSNHNLTITKAGYVPLDKLYQFTKDDIEVVFEHEELTYYKIYGKCNFTPHIIKSSDDMEETKGV